MTTQTISKLNGLEMPTLDPPVGLRIAFYGPMASGKSFCADYLWRQSVWNKMALADTLKGWAYSIFHVTGKDGVNRQFLQELGDFLRSWDDEIFIKHLLWKVHEHDAYNPHNNVVVDDVRYLNEAKYLKRNGFKLVKVDTDTEIRSKRILELYPNFDWTRITHRSEQEWEKIRPDYVIQSNTPAEAWYQLEKMLSEYESIKTRPRRKRAVR